MAVPMSLFNEKPVYEPLASRMRPHSLSEYQGQSHLLGPGKPLREVIEQSHVHSMVLWGPPGVGKTTFARLMALQCDIHFEAISAVLSGVKEIRQSVDIARQQQMTSGKKTMLFVDEVHRFNKAQQDAFLPFIEDGTIIFVGATTENPSFELNNALLSRARVYKLQSLTADELAAILDLALTDKERGLGALGLSISQGGRALLLEAADGDARRLLNALEICSDFAQTDEQGALITDEQVREVVAEGSRRFDKGGDIFYDQISALHKAVRGSDPDASLYWFVRMIDGGCDPIYVARRVVRMASEDIGNADPRGLQLALNAWEVQERLGSPEGELAIAQAIAYLAMAPKSNAVYMAVNKIKQTVAGTPSYEVPMHIRNAPTSLMKDMGHGADYRYAHDYEQGYVAGESYLPEALDGSTFYEPVNRGLEIRISEKLAQIRQMNRDSDFQRWSTSRPERQKPQGDKGA